VTHDDKFLDNFTHAGRLPRYTFRWMR